jgi:two-component system phosphate regulon sensor histidine kinase PhoR
MFSSRVFWKLLAACAGLNLLATAIFGTIVSNWQQQQLIEQVELRLRDAAVLVRGEIAGKMAQGRSEALQEQIRRLGAETGIRLTLVAPDGEVLADSSKTTLAEVAAMDNHSERPEIVRAIARGEGSWQRPSATAGDRFRYFAISVNDDGAPIGIVRSAVTVKSIEQLTASKRRLVWTLAAAVFLVALALSYLLVGRIIEPVAEISKAVDSMAKGDYRQRIYLANRDELGELAAKLNRVCQDLDNRMTQLSESHDRQSTVLGGMMEGVIAVDRRERVVFANVAAGRMFDFRPGMVEGRRLLEVVRNHTLDEAVAAVLATREPQRLETTQDGTETMSVAIQATPLPGDPCPGVVLVMHETTALRRLESLRRDFVANVSHELKTPLSSIKAYAETLRNGALNDPQASVTFVERIQEQADRLHHLILDMLSLARIESEQEVFEISSVSVQEAVDGCFAAHRPAAEAKQIQLIAESQSTGCFVKADPEGLREILDNLVDNAIKYTPDGGRVIVRWRANEAADGGSAQTATIEVEDTGIGIAADALTRVFERFYRVDKARSRELGGTGLGLAIVKHLAQSFGGGVSARSQTGQGSTFLVTLPLA